MHWRTTRKTNADKRILLSIFIMKTNKRLSRLLHARSSESFPYLSKMFMFVESCFFRIFVDIYSSHPYLWNLYITVFCHHIREKNYVWLRVSIYYIIQNDDFRYLIIMIICDCKILNSFFIRYALFQIWNEKSCNSRVFLYISKDIHESHILYKSCAF